MQIQIVRYNSDLQKKSIDLRTKVLREPLNMVYTEEQLAEESDEIHMVAVKNEIVTGVLLLKKVDENILKMRQVAVDITFQKSGIGKKLVLFAEAYAIKNNFKKIVLHARDTAKPFYINLCYSIIGNEFIEVGIPHYKMEKTL